MAPNRSLPQHEYVGCSGYSWSIDFDPAVPEVPPNHPSIRIDPVIWLKHTLSYFGVEEVNKECFRVDDGIAWQSRIRVTIPMRRDTGRPLYLSAIGMKAINQSLAYKYGVEQYVNLLASVGYNLPTYSSMMIQAIHEDGVYYDVEKHCLLMAQSNTTDLVDGADMTFAACSFEAILNQAMHACGYDWKYAYTSPTLTAAGYQDKVVATRKGSGAGPSLIIVSRPCRRAAEATKSALCIALTYLSDTYGCIIGNLHFVQFIIQRAKLFD